MVVRFLSYSFGGVDDLEEIRRSDLRWCKKVDISYRFEEWVWYTYFLLYFLYQPSPFGVSVRTSFSCPHGMPTSTSFLGKWLKCKLLEWMTAWHHNTCHLFQLVQDACIGWTAVCINELYRWCFDVFSMLSMLCMFFWGIMIPFFGISNSSKILENDLQPTTMSKRSKTWKQNALSSPPNQQYHGTETLGRWSFLVNLSESLVACCHLTHRWADPGRYLPSGWGVEQLQGGISYVFHVISMCFFSWLVSLNSKLFLPQFLRLNVDLIWSSESDVAWLLSLPLSFARGGIALSANFGVSLDHTTLSLAKWFELYRICTISISLYWDFNLVEKIENIQLDIIVRYHMILYLSTWRVSHWLIASDGTIWCLATGTLRREAEMGCHHGFLTS